MKTIKERLFANSTVNSITNCWNWNKTKTIQGYGRIKVNKKLYLPHRLSYEEFIGPIGDLCVLHKCDNPSCINPEHLFLGTKKDNVQDMFNKGRENPRKGIYNGNSKLKPHHILKIRSLFKEGTNKPILRQLFGLTDQHLNAILTYKIWKEIA